MILIRRKAQGATEYAIFIAAVLAGLLALQVYYSRSVKGKVKSSAESIGEQYELNAAHYTSTSRSVSSRNSATNTGGGVWSNSTINSNQDANYLSSDIAFVGGGNLTGFTGNEVSNQAVNGTMTDVINNTTVWQDAHIDQ